MSNLSDLIQKYIATLLSQSGQGMAEFNRKQLADKFQCAPSQINYVLETRFSNDHGFVVESRRGGGGYVRIIRLETQQSVDPGESLRAELAGSVSSRKAEIILDQLVSGQLLTKRQAVLINRVLLAETADFNSPFGDAIRAVLLRSILFVILNSDREGWV